MDEVGLIPKELDELRIRLATASDYTLWWLSQELIVKGSNTTLDLLRDEIARVRTLRWLDWIDAAEKAGRAVRP